MRIVFFGTPSAAVPSFEELAGAHEIVLTVTQPVRGRGAGRARPVADAASRRGTPVVSPERVRHVLDDIAATEAEAAAVVAFGQLIPKAVIDAFPLGMVNLHFSLLPRWRGAAPVERAILAGDEATGVSTMLIDEGLDTGPVLLTEEVPIGDDERAGEFTARLAQIGAPLLMRSLEGLAQGRITPVAQDDSRATLAPKLTPEEGRIDWTAPAGEVVRLVRACHPRPGAFTTFRGRRLEVVRAHAVGPHRDEASGTLALSSFRAAASDAWVALDEVQPEGRRVMTGDAFARGARIEPGQRLS